MNSELLTTIVAISTRNASIAEVGQNHQTPLTVNLVTPTIVHEEGKDNSIEIKHRYRNMKIKAKNKMTYKTSHKRTNRRRKA